MVVVKTFLGMVTAFWFVVILYTAGPAVETIAFPVVGKLQVDEIAEVTGKVTMQVRFNKLRNCEYVGISWFKGEKNGSFERVPIELRRPTGDSSSPNRPIGQQRSGPWILSMTLDQMRTNSFAQLYHRCHPFWLTTTDFYP